MKWFKIFAALIIAAVVIFQLAYPSATVRYRLTLEADVDGKPATGSGVIEVSYGKNRGCFPTNRNCILMCEVRRLRLIWASAACCLRC